MDIAPEEIKVVENNQHVLSGAARQTVLDACLEYARLITGKGYQLRYEPEHTLLLGPELKLTHTISMLALRGLALQTSWGGQTADSVEMTPTLDKHPLETDDPLLQVLRDASSQGGYLPLEEVESLLGNGTLIID